MGKLGEAVVEIRPDMAGLDRGLSQAEGKISGFVGSSKRLLAGLAVGSAIGMGASQIVDATVKAMDFGETLSKVGASFGTSGKVIEKTAQELADKFGLVKKTVMDGATSIGLVGQAAGMTSAQSARLGSDMVKLAADVESFANVPLEQVLLAMRSGMVGEAEPMRQFGVLMNEDAVKAEALRLGLTKSTAALSEQAKVMARVSLIKNSPAIQKMVGDLERTADSGKNQLRKFMGDLENFKTELGGQFIGPMTEALKLARELGSTLDSVFKSDKNKNGSFGEELKAIIGGMRLVNKIQNTKLSDLKGKSLQDLADQQAGVKSGLGKGPAADAQRAKDQAAHIAFLRSQGVDTSKMIFNDQSTQAGKSEKAQTQLQKFLSERKAYDARLAKNDANAREVQKFGVQQNVKAAGSIAKEFAAKVLATIASTPNAISADRTKSLPAQAQLQNLLSGPGGLLIRGALAGVQRANERISARPDQAPTQTFESSADFAKFATEQAVGADLQKQMVQRQERANELLGNVVEGVKDVANKIGMGGNAILRGRQ